MPIIKLDKDEKSFGKFKIEVPIKGEITEKMCHGIFLFISVILIFPIEINSKINIALILPYSIMTCIQDKFKIILVINKYIFINITTLKK